MARDSVGQTSGRHATWPQAWMQRENWEFETHRWLSS